MAWTCIERRNFLPSLVCLPQMFLSTGLSPCDHLPIPPHLQSFSYSFYVCVCVYIHVCVQVCLSQGFPDDLVHCGRGVIKDQGQRPFPFPWEDEWPCLKVAAYGLRAIRVCCEPATLTALCTKAGPWEKEKYSAHSPFCWNQHGTVMVNKLNAFSFSFLFFFPLLQLFSLLFSSPALFPFLHKPGKKKEMCWLQEARKKGPQRVLIPNINIWSRKSFSMWLWPYKLILELIPM